MAHHHHQYPEVEGGGSLILAWQVKNKKVLVIGGGEVRLPPCRNPPQGEMTHRES